MEYITRYRQASSITTQAGLLLVFLAATESKAATTASSQLFSGQIAQPLVFRNLLLGLRQTVESRFYRPDLWRLLDPVITSGDRLLRLECFSSCGGVYARADLGENLFADGVFHRDGTTNIDFNQPFLNQLSQLRPGKTAQFEMGEESVRITSHRGAAVEHKVTLPQRWMKGFLQVQAVQRRAAPVFEFDRLSARQLLQRIPARSDGPLYIVPRRPHPEILHRKPKTEHIAIAGGHRLRLLQSVSADLHALRVYQTAATGASIWVADTRDAQFTLGLSGEVSHGFSGDGEALRQLSNAADDNDELLFVRAAAQSLNHFTLQELAEHQHLGIDTAAEIIDRLAIQGLLGYDRDRDRYFYRQLPFLTAGDKLPERLRGSRQLLDAQAAELEYSQYSDQGLHARGWVRGKDGYYRVSLKIDPHGYLHQGECSCPWMDRHGLRRGPCKHLLALRFVAEQTP